MKNIFAQVIARGGYDLNGILKRIDEYHVEGKLSDEERAHLIAAARGEAAPVLDTSREVQRLWQEMRALTARVEKLEGSMSDEGGTPDDGGNDDIKDYVQPTGAHDAYYTDAVVNYNGKLYICIAPVGAACVWSPDAMPDYWREIVA